MNNKLCLILSLIYISFINLCVTPQGKSSINSHLCFQCSCAVIPSIPPHKTWGSAAPKFPVAIGKTPVPTGILHVLGLILHVCTHFHPSSFISHELLNRCCLCNLCYSDVL